ncbi:hypothetical protein L9F63_014915, partial [Diploptera punctata]
MQKVTAKHTISKEGPRFYIELRPIAILGKIFGLFPFENSLQSNSRLLQHKWYSFNTVYGIILHAIGFSMYSYIEDTLLFPSIMKVLGCRIFIVFGTCIYYERYLLDIIRHIEYFDELFHNKFTRIVTKHKVLGFVFTMFIAIVISIKIVACYIFYKYYRFEILAGIPGIFSYTPTIIRTIYIATYTFICYSVSSRFQDLLDQWKYIMKQHAFCQIFVRRTNQEEYLEDEYLENIRLLHGHLVGTVKKINTCYGIRLGIYFGMLFLEILHDLYLFTYNNQQRNPAQAIFNTLNIYEVFS